MKRVTMLASLVAVALLVAGTIARADSAARADDPVLVGDVGLDDEFVITLTDASGNLSQTPRSGHLHARRPRPLDSPQLRPRRARDSWYTGPLACRHGYLPRWRSDLHDHARRRQVRVQVRPARTHGRALHRWDCGHAADAPSAAQALRDGSYDRRGRSERALDGGRQVRPRCPRPLEDGELPSGRPWCEPPHRNRLRRQHQVESDAQEGDVSIRQRQHGGPQESRRAVVRSRLPCEAARHRRGRLPRLRGLPAGCRTAASRCLRPSSGRPRRTAPRSRSTCGTTRRCSES